MNKREITYYDVSPFASVSARGKASDNIQEFSDVQKLFMENMTYRSIQTCEHNYTILDGTHDGFDEYGENSALWSNRLSVAGSRLLPQPVTLDVTFGGLQSSPGIAFYFDRQNSVYADMVNVKWYRDGNLLSEATFEPDSPMYSYPHAVSLYNRVFITFTRLNMAGRYLKIEQIYFGIVRVFGEGELENLTVNEGNDPTGQTIYINSASFTINTKDTVPYLFMKRQPLHITYQGVRIGSYYIDKSKKYADRRYSIEAIDKIGVLDETEEFLGGMYNGIPAETVINQIVGGLFAVEIDERLRNVLINGMIPITGRREALSQVVFAIGAVIDCTRTDSVKIRPFPTSISRTLGKNEIYQSSANGTTFRINTEFPYTGVEVIEHNYTVGTQQELHKGRFEGEQLVKFSQPFASVYIENGAIIEKGLNHAVITGDFPNETILRGLPYIDNQNSVIVKTGDMIEGTRERFIKIENYTLVNRANSEAIAQRLYDYYIRRNVFEGDFAANAGNLSVIGDIVTVSTNFSEPSALTGNIEKMTLNLGYENIKVRGVIRGE